ncbi:hypothetical protein P7C70_g1290, partial [Phenoliferia sp. Uapishka_3]
MVAKRHMERAVIQIKGEILGSSKAHADLADLLRKQEQQLADFLNKREATRKSQGIEKLWKTKREQIDVVNKAKNKYETDALDITGMHARAALSQGRELDKVTMKMDKIQQTVLVNERDYRNYVTVLQETTKWAGSHYKKDPCAPTDPLPCRQWNQQWRAYCDLCQDQEEERLDFMKSRLWDWSNALSTVAVTEDESAERSRTALEQCDPATDLKIFVQGAGTGNEIPDPPIFIDYKVHQVPPKPSYKAARFPRSSTRTPGMQYSPSAVDEITRAFKTPPPPQQPGLPQQSIPVRQQTQQQERGRTDSQGQQPRSSSNGPAQPSPIPGPIATTAPHPSGRPAFLPESSSPTKSLTGMAHLESALSPRSPSSSEPTQQNRPPYESSNSGSSMFAVSANATSRNMSDRPTPTSASSISVPGQISAGAFQRRRSPSDAGSRSPSYQDPPSQSSAPAQYAPSSPPKPTQPAASAPAAPPPDEDDDDPILRALNQLNTTSQQQQPNRNSRSFAGPMAGSVPLPGMASQGPPPHHAPRGSSQRGSQNYGRPVSPAPTASMMQPPRPTDIPAVVNQYGQAFPGERAGSRPPSRQGSTASSHASQRAPAPANYGRSPSPQPQNNSQPLVGVGARGRSPSPQPFNATNSNHRVSQQWSQQGPPPQSQPPSQQQNFYQGPPPAQPSLAPVRPVSPLAFSGASPAGQNAHQRQYSQGRAPSPSQHSQVRAPSPSHSQAGSQHFAQHGQPQHGGYHPQQPSQGYAAQQQYPAAPRAPSPFQQPSLQQQYPQANGHGYQASAQGGYGAPQAQPQVARAPSPAPSVGAAPPPTGQYDHDGKPILFYVNAIYDYQAAGPDEFSFGSGDVIAVTATDVSPKSPFSV